MILKKGFEIAENSFYDSIGIYVLDDHIEHFYFTYRLRFINNDLQNINVIARNIKFNFYVSRCYRCQIKGAPEGKLKGSKIAIKDNIQVAQVPLSNGSRLYQGFVPEEDATVVTRILDAGLCNWA